MSKPEQRPTVEIYSDKTWYWACPGCDEVNYATEDAEEGDKIACPKCRREFVVGTRTDDADYAECRF